MACVLDGDAGRPPRIEDRTAAGTAGRNPGDQPGSPLIITIHTDDSSES
jgi:hypothetical protein